MRTIKIVFISLFLSVCTFAQPQTPAAENRKRVSLDRSLEPSISEEISSLFENVVAVQRKAKVKSGKFIFAPYLSFDFSDSPQTMYAANFNLGYAAGEFWEIYFNYVPAYVNNERSISKKVRQLPAYPDGTVPFLYVEKAKNSYGIEVNWIPVYGKDSWGPYGIVRSDTFLNIGFSRINYEVHTAVKTKLALGKTFFISDYWNLRLQAGGSFLETFNQEKKEIIVIGLLEGGLVYYF
jgi:hypothetical protein